MRSTHLSAFPAFVILYAIIYAAFGVVSPFWPLFFESRGLAPEQIGILFGLSTMMRLIAGPVFGRVADLLGALRAVLATCAALAAGMATGLLACWVKRIGPRGGRRRSTHLAAALRPLS